MDRLERFYNARLLRAAMTRIWKKRKAQLTRMQDGLLSVVGDLQGIGEEEADLVP
jgi:hypothetical protein